MKKAKILFIITSILFLCGFTPNGKIDISYNNEHKEILLNIAGFDGYDRFENIVLESVLIEQNVSDYSFNLTFKIKTYESLDVKSSNVFIDTYNGKQTPVIKKPSGFYSTNIVNYDDLIEVKFEGLQFISDECLLDQLTIETKNYDRRIRFIISNVLSVSDVPSRFNAGATWERVNEDDTYFLPIARDKQIIGGISDMYLLMHGDYIGIKGTIDLYDNTFSNSDINISLDTVTYGIYDYELIDFEYNDNEIHFEFNIHFKDPITVSFRDQKMYLMYILIEHGNDSYAIRTSMIFNLYELSYKAPLHTWNSDIEINNIETKQNNSLIIVSSSIIALTTLTVLFIKRRNR